jgi:hypothetical protein
VASTLHRLRRAISARYDTAALQAFDAAAAPPACRWLTLMRWCPAGAPPAQPRLAVVTCDAPDRELAALQAAAWGLLLDGTRQLQAARGIGGSLLRLRVKLQDAFGALSGRPHGVWDSGLLVDTPAAWQALARWVPRRATFIVVHAAPALPGALQVLATRSQAFEHPVRLLVLGRLPARAAGAGLLDSPGVTLAVWPAADAPAQSAAAG